MWQALSTLLYEQRYRTKINTYRTNFIEFEIVENSVLDKFLNDNNEYYLNSELDFLRNRNNSCAKNIQARKYFKFKMYPIQL